MSDAGEPGARRTIRFAVPGKPVAWGRVDSRIVTSKKTGRQFVSSYVPASTRAGKGAVGFHASQVMLDLPPLKGAIELLIRVYLPIPESWGKAKRAAAIAGEIRPTSKPDWDNLGKLPSDAMNGIVYVDDAQVCDAFVSSFYAERPRLQISVREVGMAHQDWTVAKSKREQLA